MSVRTLQGRLTDNILTAHCINCYHFVNVINVELRISTKPIGLVLWETCLRLTGGDFPLGHDSRCRTVES